MTTQQEKVLKPKLGLLQSARQLGNVSQACQIIGYSQDTSTVTTNSVTMVARRPSM